MHDQKIAFFENIAILFNILLIKLKHLKCYCDDNNLEQSLRKTVHL